MGDCRGSTVQVSSVGQLRGLVERVTRVGGLFQNHREMSLVVRFGVLITIDVILLGNQSVFCGYFLPLISFLVCCVP